MYELCGILGWVWNSGWQSNGECIDFAVVSMRGGGSVNNDASHALQYACSVN